jgi:pilus assembly protein Flp/PilA
MPTPVARFVQRFGADQSGATSIEYGLIISLIFLVVLTAMTAFGNTATDIFNTAMIAIRDAM